MKKIIAVFTAMALIMGLFACSKKAEEPTWQEQFDLGVRYLSEGNYEEAILTFTAAIEIDPMQADAYLNLANAYIGVNDFDAAKEILERGYELIQSEELKSKLEELGSGNIFDFWGNPRKLSGYDESGNLKWYHIYAYNRKRTLSVTIYNASGIQTGYWDGYRYDEEGKPLTGMIYNGDDGLVSGTEEWAYDEHGNLTQTNRFELDGSPQGHEIYEYGDKGTQPVRTRYYGANGDFQYYEEYTFDGERCARTTSYDADGNLQYYSEYAFDEERLIGITHYDTNGTFSGREEYYYDEQGRMIEWITYGPEGTIRGQQTLGH